MRTNWSESMPRREVRFNTTLSPREVTMLKELAEKYGLTMSDVVRLIIRNAYANNQNLQVSA